MCDDWDDLATLHTKTGELRFFYDECDFSGAFRDKFGSWIMLEVQVSPDGNNPSTTRILIDGEFYREETLDLNTETEYDNLIVQRPAGLNEFYLGSYRGVTNFFTGFIYRLEATANIEDAPCNYSNPECPWCTAGDVCPSLCSWDQWIGD